MSTGEETETDGDSRADRRVHESETVIQGLDVEVRGGSSGHGGLAHTGRGR